MATKKLQLLGNFGTGGDVSIDNSLTQSGQAADAKVTGEKISAIETQVSDLNTLVGDTSVASQIAAVAAEKSEANLIFFPLLVSDLFYLSDCLKFPIFIL